MTRAEIKTAIQALGFGTDAQSIVAQDAAITQVFLELLAEREWSFLISRSTQTLTIGNEVVPLPADMEYPKRVSALNPTAGQPGYEPLQFVSPDVLDRRLHLDNGTDVPYEFTWRRGQLVVWPRPDKAYQVYVDYVKQFDLTTFDADAESPPWANRYHGYFVWAAVAGPLAERNRDYLSLINASEHADNIKKQMIQADRGYQTQRSVNQWSGWQLVRPPGY